MDYLKKKDLFKRYRDLQLTKAELDEFLELTKNGELDYDYDRIIAELEEEDVQGVFMPHPESIKRIEKKIDHIIAKEKGRHSFKWMMRAASVAAVLFIFAGGYKYWEYKRYINLTHTYTTVSVPLGTMKILQLADGTQVTLTSGSLFKYPKAFEKNARKVFLVHGRGFFEVAKDKLRPFTVKSTRLSTTALGTSFIVQNYKDYGYEKVSLYTGKVRINQAGSERPVFLIPGQEYEKDMGRSQNLVKTFSVEKDPMIKGKLIFKNDRMDVVLYNIASFYDVKLNFNPEDLKGLFISGTFEYADVKETLNSIAYTHQLTIKKVNNSTYSITQKTRN